MAKKKEGKKLMRWWILGLILVLGGLVYLFREAIFWKTYVNEKEGFSFRYPADWKVVDYGTAQDDEKVSSKLIAVDRPGGDDNSATQLGTVTFWILDIAVFNKNKNYSDFNETK